MHRIIDYCSDRLWIALTLLIVIVSTYVMVGRYVANNVQDYRSALVDMIETRTGMRLELESLAGKWILFTPAIELNNVQLYQSAESEVPLFDAEKMILEVDLLASLLVREPRLVKLSIVGLDLPMQADAKGAITLAGLTSTKPASEVDPNLLPLLLRQNLLSIRDSSISIGFQDQAPVVVSDINMDLKRFSGFYQFASNAEIGGQDIQVVVDVNGNPLDVESSKIELYAKIGHGDVLRWLPKKIVDTIEQESHIRMSNLTMGAELWADLDYGKLSSIRGNLNNEMLRFYYKEALTPVVINQLKTRFQFDIDSKNNYELQLKDFKFFAHGERWPKSRIKLSVDKEAKTSKVQINRGVLQVLNALIVQSGMTKGNLDDMFKTINMEGEFFNAVLHTEHETESSFHLSATLQDMKFQQWRQIPAVDSIGGMIRVNPKSGLFKMDGEEVTLGSSHFFRQDLFIENMSGAIGWEINENTMRVRSGDFKISNADIEGGVVFSVVVPLGKKTQENSRGQPVPNPGSQPSGDESVEETHFSESVKPSGPELFLVAYFEKILMRNLSDYLPPILSEDVLHWLDRSLHGGKGNGRLLYHGALSWVNPLAHSLQASINFVDARLDYLPDKWPELLDANGEVFIDKSDVHFKIDSGKIWNSEINVEHGFVGQSHERPWAHVNLNGAFQSDLSDTLRLLTETPLHEATGRAAKTWHGGGNISGQLQLSVPLNDKERETEINLSTELSQVELAIPEFDLFFSDISGVLNYKHDEGLYSKPLSATFFSYPATITLPKFEIGDGTLFRLDIDSRVSLRTLETWSSQPILSFMDGVMDYHGELSIVNPQAVTSILRITSSTRGASINLPAPFKKDKHEVRDTLFQMVNQGDTFHYYIRQQEVFDSYFKNEAGQLKTLRLVVGEERDVPEGTGGVSMAGELKTLNWDEWERDVSLLIDRYKEIEERDGRGQDTSPEQKDSTDFVDMVSGINLQIDVFDGFGLQIPSLAVNAIRNDKSWWLNATSTMVRGVLKIPDDDRPMVFDLDYFYLPEEEVEINAETEKMNTAFDVQPVLDMLPEEFPAVSVKIADLQLDGWKLGEWKFSGKATDKNYEIKDLVVRLADQVVTAKASWHPDNGRSRTELSGLIRGKDIGKLMALWGQPPTIESKFTRFDFDFSWPYSPLDFSFHTLSGDANIHIKDGRFLDVGAASAIRVLGILNFAEIGRRLRLDFGDLIKTGHSFNRISGPVHFRDGALNLEKIIVKSPSSTMSLAGDINLIEDTLDLTLDVELEITKNLVAIAALVGGPAAGGGMFIIDRLIGDRVAKFAGLKYLVGGSIEEPKMQLR